MSELDAWEELEKYLELDEHIFGVVFGDFGGGWDDEAGFVPKDKRKILLSYDEAKSYMTGWSFDGGYGSPECHSTFVWTDERIIFVGKYDGSTWLTSVPRNPMDCVPHMVGGG